MKEMARVLGESADPRQVDSCGQVRVDRRHDSAIELMLPVRSVVLADEADVDVGAGQDPWIVGSGEEDVAGRLDPLQDPPVQRRRGCDCVASRPARFVRSASIADRAFSCQ